MQRCQQKYLVLSILLVHAVTTCVLHVCMLRTYTYTYVSRNRYFYIFRFLCDYSSLNVDRSNSQTQSRRSLKHNRRLFSSERKTFSIDASGGGGR